MTPRRLEIDDDVDEDDVEEEIEPAAPPDVEAGDGGELPLPLAAPAAANDTVDGAISSDCCGRCSCECSSSGLPRADSISRSD